jgi:hypothetical protein
MKKLLTGLACAAFSCAYAGGANDGVYQSTLTGSIFASVHQNGDKLFVATLSTTSLNGVTFTAGPYTMRPPSIENWTYSFGTVAGNGARVTGLSVYGACSVTSDISFDGSGVASVTFVSVANTAFGNQEGVNCSALYSALIASLGTPTQTLRKVF